MGNSQRPQAISWSPETTEAWKVPGARLRFMLVMNEFFQTEKTYYENIKHIYDFMSQDMQADFNDVDRKFYSTVLSDYENILKTNPFYNVDTMAAYADIANGIPQLSKLVEEYNKLPEVKKIKMLSEQLSNLKKSNNNDSRIQSLEGELKIAKQAAVENNEVAAKEKEIKELENQLEKPLKKLYATVAAAYTSENANDPPIQSYAMHSKSFIEKYEGITFFLQNTLPQDETLAQKAKEFALLPTSANQDFASFHIMPVQRGPRYILLLQDLANKAPAKSEEAAVINEAVEKTKKLTNEINQANATTPAKLFSHVLVTMLTDDLAKKLQEQVQQSPGLSNEIKLQQINYLQNALKSMTIESAGSDTTLKNWLEIARTYTPEAKENFISNLTPHQQMLFHVNELMNSHPERKAALMPLQNKLISLIEAENKYAAVLKLENTYMELQRIDTFNVLPDLDLGLKRIQSERITISKNMDTTQDEVNKLIASSGLIKLLSPSQTQTENLTRTQTQILPPKPRSTVTELPLGQNTLTSNPTTRVPLTTISNARFNITQVVRSNTVVDFIKPKKNPVVSLFKKESHLSSFKKQAEKNADMFVASARESGVNHALGVMDKNTKQLAYLESGVRNVIDGAVFVSSDLQTLAMRSDEVGAYAAKWKDHSDENMQEGIRQFEIALNSIVAIGDKIQQLNSLDVQLSILKKEIERNDPNSQSTLRDIFQKNGKEEINNKVQDLLKQIDDLGNLIKEKVTKLEDQYKAAASSLRDIDASLLNTFKTNTQGRIIENLKAEIRKNNSEFKSLQLALKDQPKVMVLAKLNLSDFFEDNNYNAYLAKKWANPPQDSSLIVTRLIGALNLIEVYRKECNDLEKLEGRLKEYKKTKEDLKGKRDEYSDMFKENKTQISELNKEFADKSGSQIAEMEKMVRNRKQLLQGEIQRVFRDTSVHDQQLDAIRRKNAVKNEGSPKEQAERFLRAAKEEYTQLFLKLDYLETHPQKAGALDQDKVQKTLAALKGAQDEVSSANNPQELKDIMLKNKFHENLFTKNMAVGIDQSLEVLNQHSKNVRKSHERQIADLKVPKLPNNLTKTEEFIARLDAVNKYCDQMIKLLVSQRDLMGGQTTDNKNLIESYQATKEAVDNSRKKYTATNVGGFSYSKPAQEELKTLLRSAHMKNVDSGVRDNLLRVYEGVNKVIKVRDQSAKQSIALGDKPSDKIQNETDKIKDKMAGHGTTSPLAGFGMYDHNFDNPSRNTSSPKNKGPRH